RSSRRPARFGRTASGDPSTASPRRARPPRTEKGSGGSASASAPSRSPREPPRSADQREKGRRDGEIHRNGRSTPQRGGGVALPGGPAIRGGMGSQRRRGGAGRRRA